MTDVRKYYNRLLTINELDEIYIKSGVGARIVTVVAEEIMRCGFDVESDNIDASEFRSRWDTLKGDQAVVEAFIWQRLYGGAGILLANSNGDDSQPYSPNEVLEFLRVFASVELAPQDALRPDPNDFGMPEVWTAEPLFGGGTRIPMHNSRMLKLKGRLIPASLRTKSRGSDVRMLFGMSALQGVADDIEDYEDAHWWSSLLLKRLQQLVYKGEGVADMCETGAGGRALDRKVAAADGQRSANNTLVIDADTESLDLLTGTLAGVTDLLTEKKARISLGTGIPSIILAGDTSGGLNNSAEGAMLSWVNFIARLQLHEATPLISGIVSAMYPAEKEFSIIWRPMTEETPQQMADRIAKLADADSKYLGVALTVEEVRAALQRRGDYIIENTKRPAELIEASPEDIEGAARGENTANPSDPTDSN